MTPDSGLSASTQQVGPYSSEGSPSLYSLHDDPKGHKLMALRINGIEELLPPYLDYQPPVFPPKGRHIITVGMGSSYGHAQYLAYLINKYTEYSSDARLPSRFRDFRQMPGGQDVVVFSQGLSANTFEAFNYILQETHGAVVTAQHPVLTDPDSIKGRFLAALETKGMQTIAIPLHEEYQILPRTIGPFFGYLAAHKLVEGLTQGGPQPLPPLPHGMWQDFFVSASRVAEDLAQKFPIRRMQNVLPRFVFDSPVHSFAHNLAEKVSEGAFLFRPDIREIHEFDHGTFQNSVANPYSPIFFFTSQSQDSSSKETEVMKLKNALAENGVSGVIILSAPSSVPEDAHILWYEMVLNYYVGHLIKQGQIDLVNWPGKNTEPSYASGELIIS